MSHVQTKSEPTSRGFKLPKLSFGNDYELVTPQSKSSYGRPALVFLLFGLGVAVSFLTGRIFFPYSAIPTGCQANIDLPLHKTPYIFNNSFVGGNSTADAAWETLFPPQGGFFRHPTVSKNRANFAIFHQLHCLDRMRTTYWILYNQTVDARDGKINKGFDPDALHEDYTQVHISHCFELLRNSLTCRPDTTVELKDKSIGGVTGFTAEHLCVNWDELFSWVTKWENYNKPNPKDMAS